MNIAQDLQALSAVLLDSWSKIQGKTPTTQEDLLTASRISTRLTRLVGTRDQRPAVVAEATDQRLRAFTLMLLTYEEARGAIGYLRRREEDAESIAPSLYPGKGKRRVRETAPASPNAPQPATGSAPVSADTTQPLPVVTPAQVAAANAAAAQKGAPASKDPFLP